MYVYMPWRFASLLGSPDAARRRRCLRRPLSGSPPTHLGAKSGEKALAHQTLYTHHNFIYYFQCIFL